MAISSYEFNGKTYWKVYLNLRSPTDSTIRRQKKIKWIETKKEAISLERRLIREVSAEIARLEGKGATWERVVSAWEVEVRTNKQQYSYVETTIKDTVNSLRAWTTGWLKRPASEIGKADGREVLKQLEIEGKSRSFQKKLKTSINAVYEWGIEERLIKGTQESPVRGLKLSIPTSERVPDILSIDEIRKLLFEAKRLEHEWYPVWAMALLTGMRNGELHALLWSNVDLEKNKITVSKSYQTKGKFVKSTKSGAWRTVPISDQLRDLLISLKSKAGDRKQVLPRFWQWDQGAQANVLRQFCISIGVRPVRFHALRACFATQLLAHDIAPARVMKICGWKDLKTMQHYIRVAGIEESGATQVLKVLPSDEAMMNEITYILKRKD